ncbi:hypothetical protein ABZ341_18290 [Streptomyces sp. NPDC006173]|uniref:hypothetical protein n=1 Tax=Streptomyces sp. NPDC006173 TaxID=3155349 RepID=UPI0033E9FA10
MPKIWTNSPRDIRDLKRHLREGDTVYTVRSISRHVARYEEDNEVYAAHTFTWRSPITGNLMTEHMSIEGLLAQENKVHEQPPAGMRNIADPAPQVGAPLGRNHEAYLDAAEIRGMGKLAAQTSDPRTRRRPGSWRP